MTFIVEWLSVVFRERNTSAILSFGGEISSMDSKEEGSSDEMAEEVDFLLKPGWKYCIILEAHAQEGDNGVCSFDNNARCLAPYRKDVRNPDI